MRTLKPPNYSYWSSTPVEEWEITNYDLNLCKQGPITKQAAHAHLLSDIKLLLNALPNNIRKQANVLSTQFKNRKTNTVNVKFWKTTATKLSKAHLDKAAVDTELENAAKETAVTVLTRLNKRKCKETDTIKPPPVQKKQKALVRAKHDGVQFGEMECSAGTMIKNAALELHGKFVKSKNALSPSERKVMSNGLSSILDLVDISPLGQKSLFKAND